MAWSLDLPVMRARREARPSPVSAHVQQLWGGSHLVNLMEMVNTSSSVAHLCMIRHGLDAFGGGSG